eukprot:jgi/Mesvir1/3415/Mv25298-RA.1
MEQRAGTNGQATQPCDRPHTGYTHSRPSYGRGAGCHLGAVAVAANAKLQLPVHLAAIFQIHQPRCCGPGCGRSYIECALALAPMLRVDRSAPLAREVVASGASTYGQGVVYATMEPGDVTELARAREVRGYPTLLIPTEVAYAGPRPLSAGAQQAITSQQWRVGVRSRWRDTGMHINEKEVRAAVKGVERGARSRANRGKRVVSLVDSTAVLGCLAKGRSPS